MGCVQSKSSSGDRIKDHVLETPNIKRSDSDQDDGHVRQLDVDAGASGESNSIDTLQSNIEAQTIRPQAPAGPQETPIMQKVKGILQHLLLGGAAEGPQACEEAAKVLLAALKDSTADTVSLTACSGPPGVSLLVTAQGAGAAALMRQQLVSSGNHTSAAGFFQQHSGKLPQALYRTVATEADAAALPQDWAVLYREGLRTFLAVPVTGPGGLLGVVGLACKQTGAFMEYWWEPLLSILCTGLVRVLHSPIMSQLVDLCAKLTDTRSSTALVATLLQTAGMLLNSYTNMVLGLRMGLLSPDGSQILLLHAKRTNSSGNNSRILNRTKLRQVGSGVSEPLTRTSNASSAGANEEEELTLLRISSDNTLLMDALDRQVARSVKNTVSYLEGVSEPAHDVFIEEDDVVSSIVVAPLIVNQQHFGGIYVTHNLPWSEGPGFSKAKALIVGLAGLLQRLLGQHEAGQSGRAWYELLESYARHAGRLDRPTPRVRPGSLLPTTSDAWRAATLSSGGSAAAAAQSSSAGQLPSPGAAGGVGVGAGAAFARIEEQLQQGPGGGVFKQGSGASQLSGHASGKQSVIAMREAVATSSMVEMLRQQVQRSKDRVHGKETSAVGYVEELELHRLLGKGGFGSVFSGMWKGSPAAVKVMYVQQHERQLMKNAMEMAVLTTIRHPNVVQVYACLTDMVEEAVPGSRPGPESVNRRFRPAWDGNIPLVTGCSSLCNIVVMEVCDRGNLRQAMRRGLLHKRTPNKGLVVDMRLLVTVLLEVARSIQYLHSLNIIHCDVKAENVLLKNNPANPTGFDCKLGDFGLVKLLLGKYYVTNRSGSGTVTHLAPELFEAGSKVTPLVDSYAFGIMMFELYSCQRLYAGMVPEAIINKVVHQQGRPQFPPGTPPAYQALAENCWAQHKEQRPDFDEIVQRLQALLETSGGPFVLGPVNSSAGDTAPPHD